MLARYSNSLGVYTVHFWRRDSPFGLCCDLSLVIGLKAVREDGARSGGGQAPVCEESTSGEIVWVSPIEWRLFSFSERGDRAAFANLED